MESKLSSSLSCTLFLAYLLGPTAPSWTKVPCLGVAVPVFGSVWTKSMVSALSSALEILIYVIIKNFVDLVIPPQYFNLLQVAIYFAFDF